MKKLIITLIVGLLIVPLAGFAATESDYNIQSGDNAILSSVYDRIDVLMERGDTDRLIRVYDAMPLVKIQYGTSARNNYFLNKMHDYLTERLFRAKAAPDFHCLDNRVQKGDTVTVNYSLYTDDNYKVSLSEAMLTDKEKTETILFNPGKVFFIEGLDEEVYGMRDQQTKGVYIDYHDAYGPRYEELVMQLPRQTIEEASSTPLQVGDKLTLTATINDQTKERKGTIQSINTESITVDFNAPLAGENLHGLVSIDGLFKNCGWE